MRQVYQIIADESRQNKICVVLSAMEGTTDDLLQSYQLAIQDQKYIELLDSIVTKYKSTATDLLGTTSDIIIGQIDLDRKDLQMILHGLSLSKSGNLPMQDLISGYGEIWSARIMTALLSQSHEGVMIDPREFITIEKRGQEIDLNWELTELAFQDIDKSSDIIIVPGFVARTQEGAVTTLGRNGSDLSASILAALLDAEELHIFTDVNGIYSGDPSRVENPIVLEQMSYMETLEMAYFGAQVLHPKSIQPVISRNIPIFVRNTFNPEHKGTKVSLSTPSSQKFVKAFATIESIAILTLEGSGMIGVPGISETLFRALREEHISVIMISQSSSEYSISVAISREESERAKIAVEKAFEYELHSGTIRGVHVEQDNAILSVVGDEMVHQPGIAAMLFTALGRSRINVRMIAQGSSERNISVILEEADITRALNAAHSAFYLSQLTVSVGLVGVGRIGSTLLQQLHEARDNLSTQYNLDLQINGLMNSRKMLLERDIDLATWRQSFEQTTVSADLDEFISFIQRDSIPHSVIIDCTSSQQMANQYVDWMEKGIHVITPNKKANSGAYSYYEELKTYIAKGPATNPLDKSTYYFYETTVGAGLPIIQTLQDLIKTGDMIHSIEGVFSGTLSHIFNSMDTSSSFSEIVKDAKQRGYTEPDPRDDLSGMDVARKLIILAREIGLKLEIDDVEIESLIPGELESAGTVAEFMDQLPNYDHEMTERIKIADAKGRQLRYVAHVSNDGSSFVGIKEFETDHPFSQLRGTENIIMFTTSRYSEYPLIVRGPGAGEEVTAAGVFADLLRLVDRLGSA